MKVLSYCGGKLCARVEGKTTFPILQCLPCQCPPLEWGSCQWRSIWGLVLELLKWNCEEIMGAGRFRIPIDLKPVLAFLFVVFGFAGIHFIVYVYLPTKLEVLC